MFLDKRIEENINISKNKHSENITGDISLTAEDYMPTHQRINKYKEQVASLKAKMEGLYNLKKLESIENEIKSKKEIVYNYKYENNVLNNIQKNQNKARTQFEQKYENKNEVKQLQEKLRTLKEEFKYSKDLQKSTDAKLKTQNILILSLEDKCSKIKETIEFKKRSAVMQGNTHNSLKSINSNNNEEDFEERVKYTELQVANEEKNYKNEINRQQQTISKLSEESSFINFQLKEKEQEIRINELKLKELRKINMHNKEILKGVVNRNKSNDSRAISAKPKENINNNIYNRSKSKPFVPKTPNSIRSNRPFNNIKFENKVNTNYSNLPILYDRQDTKTEKDKEDMLNQIENLSK